MEKEPDKITGWYVVCCVRIGAMKYKEERNDGGKNKEDSVEADVKSRRYIDQCKNIERGSFDKKTGDRRREDI